MENGIVYNRPLEKDFNKLNSEHKIVLGFVKEGSSVLEIGCHTGYFSFWLKSKQCKVYGVDIYGPAVERAKPYLDSFYIGDIEKIQFYKTLSGCKFDTIILMHVLEHLKRPDIVLEELIKFLNPEGNIIIALPNISNWNSRMNIMKGNFSYTDTGLMDKTHLRFFNYYTSIELIENAGIKVKDFVGNGESDFYFLPNLKLIWRANSIMTKVGRWIFRNYPNVLFHTLIFNTQKN